MKPPFVAVMFQHEMWLMNAEMEIESSMRYKADWLGLETRSEDSYFGLGRGGTYYRSLPSDGYLKWKVVSGSLFITLYAPFFRTECLVWDLRGINNLWLSPVIKFNKCAVSKHTLLGAKEHLLWVISLGCPSMLRAIYASFSDLRSTPNSLMFSINWNNTVIHPLLKSCSRLQYHVAMDFQSMTRHTITLWRVKNGGYKVFASTKSAPDCAST
jgi:hypothetical protein